MTFWACNPSAGFAPRASPNRTLTGGAADQPPFVTVELSAVEATFRQLAPTHRATQTDRGSGHDAVRVGTSLALAVSMARVYGRRNEWLDLRVASRSRRLQVFLYGLIVAALAGASYHPIIGAGALVIAVPIVATLARERRWAQDGADGEFETAIQLARLAPEYTVFNDVPFTGFNVDHVVVGPTGVWAIETKSACRSIEVCGRSLSIDGAPPHPWDPRRQARRNALDISRRLETATGERWWVEPVVCYPRAEVTVTSNVEESDVVDVARLLTRVRHGKRPMPADRQARAVEALLSLRDGTHGQRQPVTGAAR